jgi:hypothetical protein
MALCDRLKTLFPANARRISASSLLKNVQSVRFALPAPEAEPYI